MRCRTHLDYCAVIKICSNQVALAGAARADLQTRGDGVPRKAVMETRAVCAPAHAPLCAFAHAPLRSNAPRGPSKSNCAVIKLGFARIAAVRGRDASLPIRNDGIDDLIVFLRPYSSALHFLSPGPHTRGN